MSGPRLNVRSNSIAARFVPPHVSGTDRRSPAPSRSTRAHTPAVREAVAVDETEDRKEHQPAGDATPRPPPGLCSPAVVEDVHARTLVHDEDDRDVGGVVERAVALADLHRLEAVAVLEPLLDRFSMRLPRIGSPTAMPASFNTSSSASDAFPCTRISRMVSTACSSSSTNGPAAGSGRGFARSRRPALSAR